MKKIMVFAVAAIFALTLSSQAFAGAQNGEWKAQSRGRRVPGKISL